jgi:hypothetical protein
MVVKTEHKSGVIGARELNYIGLSQSRFAADLRYTLRHLPRSLPLMDSRLLLDCIVVGRFSISDTF